MIRRSLLKLANPQLLALIGVLLINWLLFPNFFRVTWQDGRFFGSLIDVLNRGAPSPSSRSAWSASSPPRASISRLAPSWP